MFFQHSVNTSKDLFAWREIERDISVAIKEAKTFIDKFIDVQFSYKLDKPNLYRYSRKRKLFE